MATHHLYNIETVGATLLQSILTGKKVLAFQTANELYISDEHDRLWNLLQLSWFLSDPTHIQERACYDAFCSKDPWALLSALGNNLSALPEPVSPIVLEPPKYGTMPPPDTWTQWPTNWTAHQAGALYYAVQATLTKRCWRRASLLTTAFMEHNRRSISSLLQSLGVHKNLTDVLETTVLTPLAMRIVDHAYASLCAPEVAKNATIVPVLGANRRAGRTFSVLPEACSVWGVESPPVKQMIGSPVWITQEPSKYWKKATVNIKVVNHELDIPEEFMEEFYTRYFPDDTPDEWSNEERAKSHGFPVPKQKAPNPWRTAFLLCRS